jgi:DNA polymerase-3 subunit gamma/tau
MIGLADASQTFELFENLLNGDTKQTIITLQDQYKNGADPLSLLKDLISITHLIAKVRLVPSFINDSSVSEAEREFLNKVKDKVSIAVLSKIWQMMIKGIGELQIAPVQIDALEMILIRVAYSASLPTPYEILNDVKKNSSLTAPLIVPEKKSADDILNAVGSGKKISSLQNEAQSAETNGNFLTFNTPESLVDYLENNKKMLLSYSLKNDVSISEFRDGYIKMILDKKADTDFIMALHKTLLEITGKQWKIDSQHGELGMTLAAKERAKDEEAKKDIMEYPLVKAIMAEFKGARIETMTRNIIEEEQNSLLNSFDDEFGESEIYTTDEE